MQFQIQTQNDTISERYFTCALTGQSIPMTKVCDGQYDCLWGEDEFDCRQRPQPESSVMTLNDYNFNQVMSMGRNVMVDFYAPWCKACVVFEPKYKCVMNEAKRQGMDLMFAKVDTDQSPTLKQYFGVNTFPRLLLFSKGGGQPRRY